MTVHPARRPQEAIARTTDRRVLIPVRIAPPPMALLRTLVVKEIGGETMGTTWSVRLAVPAGTDLPPLHDTIKQVLARIIDEMSPWEPASNITRFNNAPPGSWHHLPDGFYRVLAEGLRWAERTDGAYDPTIGASVNLWGFGPERREPARASPEAVDEARSRSGWQRVELDRASQRALQPGGLHIDLSSIAKGFAVDQVARALRANGVANMLVEIGGELRGEGVKPDGTPWWVELERPPRAAGLPLTILALAGLSVATSGDERRYFEAGSQRFAHTLDPRTGTPVAHSLISVTVAAEECMTADAAATALMVLGPEKGPGFAAEHGLAARFLSFDEGQAHEVLSPALAAMLD